MFERYLSYGKVGIWKRTTSFIGVWATLVIGVNAPVRAQVPAALESNTIQFIPATPPGADRGSTAQKVELGSRSPCLPLLRPEAGYLTALIPESNVEFTVSETPAVWAYIPDAAADISRMVLTLRHKQSGRVQRFNLEANLLSPGVVHIPWPGAPMAVGDTYDWALSIFDSCNSSDGPSERYVTGTIQRQSPSLTLEQQLNQATTQRDQAAAYAQHGIWYDALNHLGEAYRTDPDNPQLASDWTSLLMALDLNLTDYGISFDATALSTKPLLECCYQFSDLANLQP